MAFTFFRIISILEMSKLDEILKVTPGDLQRTLSELVHKVIAENRVTFDSIAETLVDDTGDDATEVYRRLVKEIFAERVIHWGRVTVFVALTIFFRDRFTLNLDDEATNVMSEYFPDWMEERQSTLRWKSARFYAGLACAVFSVKLIEATMLSHLFHSSR